MVQQTERTRPVTTGTRPPQQRHRNLSGRRAPRGIPRWLASLLLAIIVVSGPALAPGAPGGRAAAAQTASCAIPERRAVTAVPTPTPETLADPIVIAPVRRGVATPTAEAAPVATPIATPDPLLALTAELTAVAHALAACLSAGDAELVSTLATERYLGQLYGGDTPLSRDDYLALAAELDPIPTAIQTVQNVTPEGEDRASADVISVVGRQLLVSRWTFVRAPESARSEDESPWQVDQEAPLPFEPPANAAEIAVGISDYEFSLDPTTVPGPAVVLSGSNSSGQDHEMLVLRFEDGATTLDLLRGTGPGLPENITYVGQATVPAASAAELVLVDLEPGDYTVVCFFLTAEGIPHLALGMEATFTVED